jgi:Trypsin-co-occurring domain 1
MAFETGTEIIKVRLPDGTDLNFETSRSGGEQRVAKLTDVLDSREIAKTIEGTVEVLRGTFDRIKPDKASVKFGLKVAVESGHLTAVVVKGSGEANLEVTLEWSGSRPSKAPGEAASISTASG